MVAKTRKVRNPNGTVRTFRGEEADQLTASEFMAFRNRMATMSDDALLACFVEAPEVVPAVVLP